jgi:hypothetical protein
MQKKQPKRTYVAGNGKAYPLYEAPYKYDITVYKTDCPKASIGDPEHCLIARGALRDKALEAAYIGAGKDAYLCFKATKLRKAYALHFTINAEAGRIRDFFDTHKGVATRTVTLSPPTAGRTLDYRSKLNKKRRAEIKAGAPVNKRGKPNTTRIMRIGVKLRPRAQIVNNVVSMPQRSDVAA